LLHLTKDVQSDTRYNDGCDVDATATRLNGLEYELRYRRNDRSIPRHQAIYKPADERTDRHRPHPKEAEETNDHPAATS
jgi:hypothetical protein